jgi:FKBP-type peptidyl-prolyl cis-trans isomerase
MNKTALRSSLLAGLVLAAGCGATKDEPAGELPAPPKQGEIYQKELLNPPAEHVRTDSRTAKDFPELQVDVVKAGEGEATLGAWATGMFHSVYKLASGKEIKNTFKLDAPEEVAMIEGAAMPGVVFGCIGMKKGEVRSLLIPADLAYGEEGDPGSGIPANATVLARMELVEMGAAPDPDFLIRRAAPGTGKPVRSGQFVKMHYTGVLADGEKAGLQFDSSRTANREPYRVQIGPNGSVINGWKLGLRGMKVGEKRWLKIPPHLAYGSSGSGAIPPDATLIFEVELVSIESGPPLQGGPPGSFPGGQFPGGQFPGGEFPGQGR